jgi:hypothetical protein
MKATGEPYTEVVRDIHLLLFARVHILSTGYFKYYYKSRFDKAISVLCYSIKKISGSQHKNEIICIFQKKKNTAPFSMTLTKAAIIAGDISWLVI